MLHVGTSCGELLKAALSHIHTHKAKNLVLCNISNGMD